MDLSFGGTVWCNNWNPAWRDGRIKVRNIINNFTDITDTVQNLHDFKSVWMPLYGPVLTLSFFRRVSISSYFVYGTTVFRSTGIALNTGINYTSQSAISSFGYRMYKRETVKMDSDTTVGFNVTEYLFLYVGYKYQSYKYTETSKTLHNYTTVMISTPRFKKNSNHGAGIGIGFNIHLYDALFLQLGFSGVLLAGLEESSKNYQANVTASTIGMSLEKKGSYLAYGGTFVPTFAYRTPVNLTLYLGFRAQLLRYRQLNGKQAYELINNQMDFFYGVTFSAVYTISFDKKS